MAGLFQLSILTPDRTVFEGQVQYVHAPGTEGYFGVLADHAALVTGLASGMLPSRGPWMVVVKKSFGIVMWLGAIYYAAPQLPVPVTALATE